jgi:hypothetical protein
MNLVLVTVVKNDTDAFLQTSESLMNLTGKFEWIVISPDLEISELLSVLVHENPKLNARYIKDKGGGIYTAMQIAVDRIPNNPWVWFINAGDVFSEKNTIEKLDTWLEREDLQWISTKVRYLTNSGDYLFTSSSKVNLVSQLFAKKFVSHQGFVCKLDVINSVGGFDPNYRIAADWDLICKVTGRFQGQSVDLETTVFRLGGASSIHRNLGNIDLLKLRSKFLGRKWWLISHIWFAHRVVRNLFILALEQLDPKSANKLRQFFWKIKTR